MPLGRRLRPLPRVRGRTGAPTSLPRGTPSLCAPAPPCPALTSASPTLPQDGGGARSQSGKEEVTSRRSSASRLYFRFPGGVGRSVRQPPPPPRARVSGVSAAIPGRAPPPLVAGGPSRDGPRGPGDPPRRHRRAARRARSRAGVREREPPGRGRGWCCGSAS